MPRACVTTNYEDFNSGRSSDPMNSYVDYCQSCYSDICLEEIATEYGVPDDAIEMDCEHPWYGEYESDYSCEQCGCALTDEDN